MYEARACTHECHLCAGDWPMDPFKFFLLFIYLPFCHGPPSMILATTKKTTAKRITIYNRRKHFYNHSVSLISPHSLHTSRSATIVTYFRFYFVSFCLNVCVRNKISINDLCENKTYFRIVCHLLRKPFLQVE